MTVLPIHTYIQQLALLFMHMYIYVIFWSAVGLPSVHMSPPLVVERDLVPLILPADRQEGPHSQVSVTLGNMAGQDDRVAYTSHTE